MGQVKKVCKRGHERTPENLYKRTCKTCALECARVNAKKCEHGHQRQYCKDCKALGTGGNGICEHGRRCDLCKECKSLGVGGGSLCEHQRQRTHCKECKVLGVGGSAFCQHGRTFDVCEECGGGSICEHHRKRSYCKDCFDAGTGGGAICCHRHMRVSCMECFDANEGGGSICQHRRIQSSCKECGGFIVLAKEMWGRAKGRAKHRGLSFTITVDDILELIGDGKCPVFNTAYPLDSRQMCDESASLDRFIPSQGYTKENCAVLSMLANNIKTNATAGQVLQVARWMFQQAVA